MGKNIIVITGPSGVGKTTLQNYLKQELNILPLLCTTTRNSRPDDNPNEIKCVSKEEFDNMISQNRFFFYSGDVFKYGYSILDNNSYANSFVTSYRDLPEIFLKDEYNIFSIVLAFNNIEKSIRERLELRNSSEADISMRIRFALDDYEKNFEYARKTSNLVIYTDKIGIEETYLLTKEKILENIPFEKKLALKV